MGSSVDTEIGSRGSGLERHGSGYGNNANHASVPFRDAGGAAVACLGPFTGQGSNRQPRSSPTRSVQDWTVPTRMQLGFRTDLSIFHAGRVLFTRHGPQPWPAEPLPDHPLLARLALPHPMH